ncbi:zinc-dependent alcohol dehydrogenase [[Eubacterium] cellulosolvens]
MAIKVKMKAAVAYGPSDIKIEYVDTPSLEDDDVLVKVKAIGVCPSDVRVYKGVYKRKYYEYGSDSYGLSGHEWSGEVAEVGDSVKQFAIGDRVAPEILVPCHTCRACRRGVVNLCPNKKVLNRGYAEYVKVPSEFLFLLPPKVSYEAAAFVEPIATVLRANEKISPRPGDIVLVIGAGPMGLLHLQVSKLSGATVAVSEVVASRLKMAKKLDADAIINPAKEDLQKRIKELTNGYGADHIVVSTGDTKAIESAFTAVNSTGTILLFGGTYPPSTVPVDPNLIHYNEIRVIGSFAHRTVNVEKALKILSDNAIRTEELISNTFRLDQLKEAFELVDSGRSLKVNVKP